VERYKLSCAKIKSISGGVAEADPGFFVRGVHH